MSNTRRRGRQALMTEGNTSSLPTNYVMNENEALRYRPEFRKSSSQPTRSLSPPSLRSRSPSQSIGTPPGSVGLFNKKRHLPQVPAINRRLVENPPTINLDPHQIQRTWRPHTQQRRPEVVTPSGMYSDSEITTRPVFGNRQFYAHPIKDSGQHHRKDSTRHSRRQTSTSGYREYQSETEGHREKERRESYRELRDDSRENRRDSRDTRDRHDSRDPRDRHESRDTRDRHESRDPRDRHDIRDPRDRHESRDPRDRHDSRDPRDRHESRETRERRDSQRSRGGRRVSAGGQHVGGESGEESETSTNSKISVQSALSTHSDRPRPSRTLR